MPGGILHPNKGENKMTIYEIKERTKKYIITEARKSEKILTKYIDQIREKYLNKITQDCTDSLKMG